MGKADGPRLAIRPIKLREANAYVAQHHRHNQPTNGHKWSLGCYDGDRLCGVAIAGQPIARKLDDGLTIEVRRVCTDGTKNACSALYGACARVARNMGYRKIITYTLMSEPGTSLKASGWTNCGEAGGYRGMSPQGQERWNRSRCLARSRNIRMRKNTDGRRCFMTNADRIRAMTDEELAVHLQLYWGCTNCLGYSIRCDNKCEEFWLKWLKQEVSDNG